MSEKYANPVPIRERTETTTTEYLYVSIQCPICLSEIRREKDIQYADKSDHLIKELRNKLILHLQRKPSSKPSECQQIRTANWGEHENVQ